MFILYSILYVLAIFYISIVIKNSTPPFIFLTPHSISNFFEYVLTIDKPSPVPPKSLFLDLSIL